MGENIIKIYLTWARKINKINGITVLDIKRSDKNASKQSAYVDIASNTDLLRITLWETGEIDLEQISIDTGETICYKSLIVESTNCIAVCSDFVKRII